MLTPLDIENKKFSKQMMSGYSVDEVDEFLDEITADYEKLYKESAEAKNKIEDMQEDMAKYKNIENTLNNTLIMAQTAADDVKNLAKQQAEAILNEAQAAVVDYNLSILKQHKSRKYCYGLEPDMPDLFGKISYINILGEKFKPNEYKMYRRWIINFYHPDKNPKTSSAFMKELYFLLA